MSFFTTYILPFIYLLLLAFLLQRNKYLLQNGFSKIFIAGFFFAKCLAGVINDYTSFQYNGDVGLYFDDGLILYQTLLKDPPAFAGMINQMFNISDFSLLDPHSSFIRTVFEGIKFIHFFADLFSFGNLYTNTILFNGIATVAMLHCWVFLKKYSGGWFAGGLLFLLPSCFFFTSNILKEGLCYVLMAAMLPLASRLLKNISFKILTLFCVWFLLLFFFKFMIAITFGIAIAAWWLLEKYPNQKLTITLGILIICVTVFFATKYIAPSLDFPAILIDRQQEFMKMPASSKIDLVIPEAGPGGFLKALPFAIRNVFFKPLPGEGGKALYLAFTLEIFIFWLVVGLLWIKNRFRFSPGNLPPLFWSHTFYALANLLIIGLIIPNIGAMVRYRSIFLPWLALYFWYVFNGDKWLAERKENRHKSEGLTA